MNNPSAESASKKKKLIILCGHHCHKCKEYFKEIQIHIYMLHGLVPQDIPIIIAMLYHFTSLIWWQISVKMFVNIVPICQKNYYFYLSNLQHSNSRYCRMPRVHEVMERPCDYLRELHVVKFTDWKMIFFFYEIINHTFLYSISFC